MGNVNMEASQINYRGGQKKMSVEEALKNTSVELDTLKSGLNYQTVPQLVTTVTLASGLSGKVTCVKIGQLVLVSGYCSGTIAQNDEIIHNLPPYRTDFGIQYCRYPAILDGSITSPMLFTAYNALSVVAACSSVNFFVMYVTN